MKKLLLLSFAMLFLLTGCQVVMPGGSTESNALQSIAAYPETLHLKKGDQEVIQVVMTPSDAPESEFIWTSSNKSVATVDSRGMVSAIGDGNCTISVASKEYSDVSTHVEVIVGAGEEQDSGEKQTASSSGNAASWDTYVVYVQETNPASVYPTYYLSEREVSAMDQEGIQFVINQIYAKNGYVFRTEHIQQYFSQMPWYVPVSNDVSRLHMSSLDRSNLNLLVRYRDSSSGSSSSLGWMWSRYAVDSPLSASYVRNLSQYDVQLLINTIYAKNGYIFNTQSLQNMFEGQPWYHGRTRDSSQLQFSSMDQSNLNLLIQYR